MVIKLYLNDRVKLSENVIIPDTSNYNVVVKPHHRFEDVISFLGFEETYRNMEYAIINMPRRRITPPHKPDRITPWQPEDPDLGDRPDGDGLPPGQPIIQPWEIPQGPATPHPDYPGGPPAASVKIYIR